MKQQDRRRQNCSRRLVLIIIGLFLGVNIYFANAGGIAGNRLPMPFGCGIANVMSGSMEPTFSKGALLLIKETSDIEVGDIVVYQADSMLISHRVVRLDSDIAVTKGDANNTEDQPFDRSLIRGKVIGWIPGLGDAAEVLKKPAVSMFLLMAAFFSVGEASFRKEREEDVRKKELLKEEIRRLKEERGN